MSSPVIGFAGMTHLGIVSAAAAAARGFSVVCYDPAADRIDAIASGRLPVFEPNLEETCRANASRMKFVSDVSELDACNVVYVAPDVATNGLGESDLAAIYTLVAQVIARSASFTIVVLSQVPPGFTRTLKSGSHPLYYQVETLVFGIALERALKPERYIVGCADPSSPLPDAYETFLNAYACPILPMRYESAELAKIAINCCLVAMVSTANTLAELCEVIGADWSEIVPALRLDRRIGQYSYLAPGLGIAGGNLERDLATVQKLATLEGSDAGVVSAWVANSRHRRDWPIRVLERTILANKPDAQIGILGLAYKQDTHSIKNSAAVALVDALSSVRIKVYDPVVNASTVLRSNLTHMPDPLQVADAADAVALMTPWPEFRKIDPAEIAARMRGNLLLDPYGLLSASACRAAGLEQYRLGVSQ